MIKATSKIAISACTVSIGIPIWCLCHCSLLTFLVISLRLKYFFFLYQSQFPIRQIDLSHSVSVFCAIDICVTCAAYSTTLLAAGSTHIYMHMTCVTLYRHTSEQVGTGYIYTVRAYYCDFISLGVTLSFSSNSSATICIIIEPDSIGRLSNTDRWCTFHRKSTA